MQKMMPYLWFREKPETAVDFYVSIFKNSRKKGITRYSEAGAKVSGITKDSIMTIEFELEGQPFIALNGGPVFSFTPAVSFYVGCDTLEEIDEKWRRLSEGAAVMMEYAKYPFAEKYGWLTDRFGVSWQLILMPRPQKITPCLMFTGAYAGKAEEAINSYVSIFPSSHVGMMSRYGKGGVDKEGTINHAEFSLNGQDFVAMDSALEHKFGFSEAISFLINCDSQKEIDALWQQLTASGGQEGQCGWLKDRYGVSWQVSATALSKFLKDKDPAKVERVMKALLQMKKIDIKALKEAYK